MDSRTRHPLLLRLLGPALLCLVAPGTALSLPQTPCDPTVSMNVPDQTGCAAGALWRYWRAYEKQYEQKVHIRVYSEDGTSYHHWKWLAWPPHRYLSTVSGYRVTDPGRPPGEENGYQFVGVILQFAPGLLGWVTLVVAALALLGGGLWGVRKLRRPSAEPG